MPFLELPCLTPIRETDSGTIWITDRPCAYRSAITEKLYCVPGGFVTDLASVPRVPFAYWSLGGRAAAAAVVHDFLFAEGIRLGLIMDMQEANAVFLEAMLETGVPEKMAYSIYFATVNYGEAFFRS